MSVDIHDEPQYKPPQPGTRIYHRDRWYRIGACLAAGHFSAVFECWDEWDNQLVAKILSPKGTYGEVRSKWIDETRKLVHLRHPNITFVFDAFEYENTFYLVMERCYKTLADIIALPGFSGESWLLPVARSVLQAVNFIHDNGYVHKDLHIGNVLTSWVKDELLPDKVPALVFKVADLGISRLETEIDSMHTELALWMLPPESLRPDEFGKIGKATDIYHVGLLLMAVLMGHNPTFTQEQILDGEPRRVAGTLSSPYTPVIARTLRRHTGYRTPNAITLWRELKAAHQEAEQRTAGERPT